MKRKGGATIKLVLQDTRIDDALARCIRMEEHHQELHDQVLKLTARIEALETRPVGGRTREPK